MIKAQAAVLERSGAARPYRISRPVSLSEVLLAAPGPTEVLLRIEAAGVCHSDLSVVDGSRPRALPLVLGHEAAGVVEAAGADVDPALVRRRVVTTFLPRCGECAACATGGRLPCSAGAAANGRGSLISGARRASRDGKALHHHLGVSAFATHAVVDHRSIVPVSDDTPPEVAAVLGCAVLTGGGALLNTAPPPAGATVAVVGLGGVGLAALLVARAMPISRLIAVDRLPAKRDVALSLGADVALSPEAAVEAAVKADVVVEAAGHPAAFETAWALTAPGGTTVTVGLPSPQSVASIHPLLLTAEAREIKGCYMGAAVPSRDIPRYEQWWREGRLPVERLISSFVSLSDINDALDRLADGSEIRQVIRFPLQEAM
jgi:alcohol dehydrogenase